jgi:hypothetical protein
MDVMDDEELCARPQGTLLTDGGGVYFAISLVKLAADVYDGAAGCVLVEGACGIHDEGRHAEKLVHAMACRSCTSCLYLQVRWNK